MDATFKVWPMPATAASVRLARHRVTALLRADQWTDDRVAEVALMTSELVTNAVEHARTPFTVTADLTGVRLRVEIRDASDVQPVNNPEPSVTDLSGRGLLIVAALADQWGVEPTFGGKSVWFERAPDRD